MLRTRAIIWFWLPLAATWLMMSVEGPYVAGIIARMPDAALNLAAYGVAFAIAWLVEAPVMMLMTAANTLAQHRQSFLAMRRFMYTICGAVTVVMALAAVPPVFAFLAAQMDLPADVASLAHAAVAILFPWPAAIGYRRFYQGVLVRHRLARRVAYGTVVRLLTMSVAAGWLAFGTQLHGSSIGAIALAAGVVAEAIASRWMARHIIATILADTSEPTSVPLTQRAIARFYYPLALTSVISTAAAPLFTFFMARSRMPIESLAVIPVIHALLFLFRSGGIAFQEVGIALSGSHREHESEVARAARVLAAVATACLAVVLFTPLGDVWLRDISGLPPALAAFALVPAQLLVFHPAMEYWLSFQRSRFILNGRTRIVTIATLLEIVSIATVLLICVGRLNMIGAIAASIAMVVGRLASNGYLFAVSRPARTAALPAQAA